MQPATINSPAPSHVVSARALLDMDARLPSVDVDRLRADLDAIASQDPEPRA